MAGNQLCEQKNIRGCVSRRVVEVEVVEVVSRISGCVSSSWEPLLYVIVSEDDIIQSCISRFVFLNTISFVNSRILISCAIFKYNAYRHSYLEIVRQISVSKFLCFLLNLNLCLYLFYNF